MKKYNLIPLLAVIGILGLSGCSSIDITKAGEGAPLDEGAATIICNEVQENGRYLSSSKIGSSVLYDERPIYPISGTYDETSYSVESNVYKNYIIDVSSKFSLKSGIGSEYGITSTENIDTTKWIGDPVDTTLANKKQLFTKTVITLDGISTDSYSAGEVIESAEIDSYYELAKISSLSSITAMNYNFMYDSDYSYLKISDNVVKCFDSNFKKATAIENPSYPGDATKYLQPFDSDNAVYVFEKLDSFGWVVTSAWVQDQRCIYTNNEFELLDEPLILINEEVTTKFSYALNENLPTSSKELVYVAPDETIADLSPAIAISDGTTVSSYVVSFANVTNAWNQQHGTSAKAVFTCTGRVNFQYGQYFGLTNIGKKNAGISEAWGLDSVTFEPSAASSNFETYTALAGSKLFTLTKSAGTYTSGYFTYVYDDDDNVQIIYTHISNTY